MYGIVISKMPFPYGCGVEKEDRKRLSGVVSEQGRRRDNELFAGKFKH